MDSEPNGVSPTSSTDLRAAADRHDALLRRRLDVLVPDLMERAGLEAWVIDAREYNEDPVAATMLPATWWGTARRRTILVFKDAGRARAAISRYPAGPFPAAWDPGAQPDQWAALANYLADVAGPVGVDRSEVFSLADGLTHSEGRRLIEVVGQERARSAEEVAIGWLETRLPEEAVSMQAGCQVAHAYLRRALSSEVITPGLTTTQDVAWWMVQHAHEDGLRVWFHPGVTIQRRGEIPPSPADGVTDLVIEAGDLVHIDFGIVRDGYHTDQQQHAYVCLPGEKSAPETMLAGFAAANRLQDILMSEMRPGRTGNEVLRSTLAMAREESIRPIVYSHPIGLHGHAAGATIGLWDGQDGVPGAGDYPVGANTGWSIELAVEIDFPEWEGQTVKIMLEENAFLEEESIRLLDGRQTEPWLV